MHCLLLLLLCLPLFVPAQGLKITHLVGDCYVYTTWMDYGGSPFPANGMYVLTTSGAVLLDTPWDTTQTQPLIDLIAERHHMTVALAIATHSHADRTGGFDQLKRRGIPTYASAQTRDRCIETNEPLPQHVFLRDTSLTIGGLRMDWHYPGPGHTSDNIVVWLPGERILYGGCLVKSVEAGGLGNISDADLAAWPSTMESLLRDYPQVRWVIPGHQAWVPGTKALKHTLKLLRKADSKK